MLKVLILFSYFFSLSLQASQSIGELSSLKINQLMAIVCTGSSAKNFPLDPFSLQLHQWYVEKDEKEFKISGACSRVIQADKTLSKGQVVRWVVGLNDLKSPNAILGGQIGTSGFKFRFRDGVLESFVQYEIGPMYYMPGFFRTIANNPGKSMPEILSPTRISWQDSQWSDGLKLTGYGDRWATGMNIWSKKEPMGDFVYIDALDIMTWANQYGRVGAEQAQSIFWILGEKFGKGCSHQKLSSVTCLDIWNSLKAGY